MTAVRCQGILHVLGPHFTFMVFLYLLVDVRLKECRSYDSVHAIFHVQSLHLRLYPVFIMHVFLCMITVLCSA